MSQENGDALGAFKANIEAMAETELEKLNEQASELQEQLSHVRAQQRSVRAILVASGPPRKRLKKGHSQAGKQFTVSPERRATFEQWLVEHGQQEFTTSSVRAAFPSWSGSYINSVIKQLREEGAIRKAAQSGQTPIYKVVA